MDEGAWCPWGPKESDTTERLHFAQHTERQKKKNGKEARFPFYRNINKLKMGKEENESSFLNLI